MLNGIMFQAFEWYLPPDGKHYARLMGLIPELASRGVTAIWLPPVYKAQAGIHDTGYAVYDLYDLGEFDQKGSVVTKYGSKDELLACIKLCHDHGLQVYMDVVLNHRSGADETETVMAMKMDPDQREQAISDPYEIDAWTRFTFPGRAGRYADKTLHWYHFTACDYDARNDESGIFRFIGENKYWAEDVSKEYGNFDYLMGVDVDFAHPEVVEDLLNWAIWFVETTNCDGFRMDAVKHMSAGFVHNFVQAMRERFGPDFFFVAEYWDANLHQLDEYLDDTGKLLTLFDVALHFKFHQAAVEGEQFDLRTIFDQTAVAKDPLHTVTFVENHDSQPGQALESPVDAWFKQQAYALILLREAGYPCVFYGDYLGTGDESLVSMQSVLAKLMSLRRIYARGEQIDYPESANCIAWLRRSETDESAPPLVVVLSNGPEAMVRVEVGEAFSGEVYADYLGNLEDKITIDEDGFGEFPVAEASLSCWLRDKMTLNLWEVEDK